MDNKRISGILKHNESTNPRAPQLKGWVQINGVHYWMSAFYKPEGNGIPGAKMEFEPHFQVSFEPDVKEAQNHVGGTPFSTRKPYLGIPPHADKLAMPNTSVNAGAHPSANPNRENEDIPF